MKVCGVTRLEDALMVAEVGADGIGLNFVEGSPRRIDVETGRAITAALKGKADIVAVVADMTPEQMQRLREDTGISWLQLHGDEPAEVVRQLMPDVWKAVRIGNSDDVRRARLYPGPSILVDAKVGNLRGGSGATFDWSLVKRLATERRLVLAGGLNPDNVRDAVLAVGPWGVDVASGVESSPGVKDPAKVKAFIEAARGAALERLALTEEAGASR